MRGKRLALLIAVALTAGYLAVLAMSAGHLAYWYAATLGPLPQGLAWGLAASLEAVAFLLSMTSNVLPQASKWAASGSVAALGLVWAGNYLSMRRFALADVPTWEVALASSFVPIGTYMVGKVIGELTRHALEEPPPSKGEDDLTLLARELLTGGNRVKALQTRGIGRPAVAQAIVAYVAGNPEPYRKLRQVEKEAAPLPPKEEA
jgi:hypothetical protein